VIFIGKAPLWFGYSLSILLKRKKINIIAEKRKSTYTGAKI